MTVSTHSRRRFLLGAVAAALVPSPALAQEGIRQLTLVVGFPPGGATDILARLIADGMRGPYAQTVIVENKPGAAGRVGVEYVKNAKNDGSTLLFTPAFPMLIAPHVYPKLSYDTLRDFVPVGIGARSMLCLAVGPGVPASVKTIPEFIEWVRANPAKAVFGAPSGSSQHFAGQTFARAAKIKLDQVPYKGGAPAMTDLIGGHLPANVSPTAEALPHHQAGTIRILAVTGAKRSRFLPEVPTMGELGYPDVLFQDWLGLFAPSGTPPGIVARANGAAAAAVKSDAGIAGLGKLGMELDLATPAAFAQMVRADWERYGKVVQASGFKPED
jgi:tripartite-type tricarboxylate transporter receptor subunit TctC